MLAQSNLESTFVKIYLVNNNSQLFLLLNHYPIIPNKDYIYLNGYNIDFIIYTEFNAQLLLLELIKIL